MKVRTVEFARTKSVNYQSEKVGVVIELEDRESYTDAFRAARALVSAELGESPKRSDIEAAEAVLTAAHAHASLIRKIK